jgi:hypothetical protein
MADGDYSTIDPTGPQPSSGIAKLAIVQESVEIAALDGAVSGRTGIAVLVDVNALADRPMPDPAAMRKIG